MATKYAGYMGKVIQVDLTNQTESVVGAYNYVLCNEAGEPVDAQMVTTNVEEVNLSVKIQRLKEVPLKLNLVAGGGATEQTSAIDIQPKVIRISGSDSLLEGLDELDLGTINLGEIGTDTTMTLPIILPEGITNETGITEATVEVKFPNLRTTSMNVDNIQLLNVPEGLEAELVTQVLEVKLRGPAALIDSIEPEHVTITVDLASAKAGTDKYTAQVLVQSAYNGVGAMNSYTVMVTLTEAEGN